MSTQLLSDKTLRRIERSIGPENLAGRTIPFGWANGGPIHSFVTNRHEHGWYDMRSEKWGFFSESGGEHYPECERLGTVTEPDKRFITDEKLANWIGFHPADTEQKRTGHEIVRTMCWVMATELNELLPEGTEKTLALRAVQDVGLRANTCLAIGGGPAVEAHLVGWKGECEVMAERLLALSTGELVNPVVS